MASNQDLFTRKKKVKNQVPRKRPAKVLTATTAAKGQGGSQRPNKQSWLSRSLAYEAAQKEARRPNQDLNKWFKTPAVVADMFIATPYEDMSDELQSFKEYLVNLTEAKAKASPLVNRQLKARQAEFSTLNMLGSQIPYTMIKPFFNFMKSEGYNLVSEAYSAFVKEPEVIQELDQMKDLLRSRQAVPSGAKVASQAASQAVGNQRFYLQSPALTRCMNTYLYTPWIKGSQRSYKGIAINILTPSNQNPKFRGQYLTTNNGEWYEASYDWYQHMCAYGRSFEKNSVAYIVDDGLLTPGQRRLELEDEDMFQETSEVYLQFKKYTLDKRVRNLECDSVRYKTAPWMPELNVQEFVINTKVLTTLPDRLQGILMRSTAEPFSEHWSRLKVGYYKRICSDGRPYVQGLIGYLNRTGARLEVIIETENMYRRSLQLPEQTTPQDVKKLLECNITQYRKAPWVPYLSVQDILVNLPRLNSLPNGPEKALVRASIENYYDINWAVLSNGFFEEVCQHGRQFVEGLIGYLTYQEQLEILPETQELVKKANQMSDCNPNLYRKAPWTPYLRIQDLVINTQFLHTVPEPFRSRLKGYVRAQIPNTPWAKVSDSFFRWACRGPRDFVPNLIGYLRVNEKRYVVPETQQLFDLIGLQSPRPQNYNRDVSYGSEFKEVCEQRLYDWLRSVKATAFVAKKNADTEPWLGPQVEGTDWFVLSKPWYKQVCRQTRNFIPGLLGLRLNSGKVIPEDKSLFEDLQQALKGSSKLEISPRVVDIAATVLGSFMNERIARDLANKLIQEVQLSGDPSTAYSRYLTRVATLVTYASSLINIPQVHVYRLINNQYTADTLLALSEEDMLPEIFLDPSRDPSSNVDNTIDWASFKDLINERVTFFRHHLERSIRTDNLKPYKAPPILKVKSVPCSVVFDDRVYYLEDGDLQCFARATILQVINEAEAAGDLARNPNTNKDLSPAFIEKTKSILDPGQALKGSRPRSRPSSRLRSSSVSIVRSSEGEDSLDLFNAALTYLHSLDIPMDIDEGYQFCTECKVNNPPILKSVKKGQEVSFCSYDCFRKFKF